MKNTGAVSEDQHTTRSEDQTDRLVPLFLLGAQ